jgi:uncharacterized protein (DUF934 family)
MPKLIKSDGTLVDDGVTVLRDAAGVLPGGPVLVPLARWLAEHDALRARGDVGVWLAPADDPAALAADVASLALIGVDFPTFADGRGYSTATATAGSCARSAASSATSSPTCCKSASMPLP